VALVCFNCQATTCDNAGSGKIMYHQSANTISLFLRFWKICGDEASKFLVVLVV